MRYCEEKEVTLIMVVVVVQNWEMEVRRRMMRRRGRNFN
jgi:hypothetical protein